MGALPLPLKAHLLVVPARKSEYGDSERTLSRYPGDGGAQPKPYTTAMQQVDGAH